VGRDAERLRLRAHLAELRRGRGGVAWLEGEPGIGKSALIASLVDGAVSVGAQVLRAEGDELSARVGLRLLADALLAGEADPIRDEIADLLAGRGRGLDVLLAATERMTVLVEQECGRGPVILALDDLQWADDESLAAMHSLLRVADQSPLLVIAAARSMPSRDALLRLRTAVLRRADATVIELNPLDDTAVARMITARVGGPPGPALIESLAGAGGNPLFVIELVDALMSQGSVRAVDGVVDLIPGAEAHSASLTAAITRRIDFLSQEARSMLRSAAVLDSRFAISELVAMCGVAAPTVIRLVDEALAAGVLTGQGRELTFRHPLIRQALHRDLPESLRIGLHEHAAKVLAGAGAGWDRVARHLLAAPEAIDGWVLEWLAGVSREALLAKPALAGDLLARVRVVMAPDDFRRSRVSARLAAVLYHLNCFEELVELGPSVLHGIADASSAGEFAWYLARAYQQLPGRAGKGLAMIEEFLGRADPGPPWRSRLLAQRAVVVADSGRHEDARRYVAEALEAGERDGDPISCGTALNAQLKFSGREEALDIVDRALALPWADDPEAIDVRMLLMANRLICLLNLVWWAEYERALVATVVEAERVGSARIAEIQVTAVNYYYGRGDWDQSLTYAGQIEPRTALIAIMVRGIAAMIHARRGDREQAEEQLAALAEFPAEGQLNDLILGRGRVMARALLAEAEADLPEAISTLSVWLDSRFESNRYGSRSRGVPLTLLARMALAHGDQETALAAAAAADSDAAANPDDRIVQTYGRIVRAVADGEPAPLLAAIDEFAAESFPTDVAMVAEEAAAALARRGDLVGARVAFNQAADLYDDFGATNDLRRLQVRLRGYGIRRGTRAQHRRARFGWEALTAAERSVVDLVVEGLSNPEIASRLFISRRTVETHVYNALRKLQLRSRVDLRLVVGRQADESQHRPAVAVPADSES
jgi:DNA-binding CsgD family transcriptional regulator